jgi:hypothetical protein
MILLPRLIATASLAAFAAALLAPTRADDPPPKKSLTDAEKELRAHAWATDPALRKTLLAAYPFESLEDRLRFDAPGRKRVAKALPTGDLDLDRSKALLSTGPTTKIPPAALATLLADDRVNREGHFDRVRALSALHQLEVNKFVTNPGFGNMRLIVGRTPRTEPPTADWSEADRGEPVRLPAAGEFFTAGPDKKGPTLPSVLALAAFHTSVAHEFARPDSWGLVKDRAQVAGFQPHAVGFLPDGHTRQRFDLEHPTKDKAGRVTGYPVIERWSVRQVELIGLLIHDAPVVYLNPDGKLPTMAAAREAKTRELTEFEAGGLKDLAAGKEVVAVDAATNHVRMVGAIRMAGACLKCHEGTKGDLLGAFTYDLVRVPAQK